MEGLQWWLCMTDVDSLAPLMPTPINRQQWRQLMLRLLMLRTVTERARLLLSILISNAACPPIATSHHRVMPANCIAGHSLSLLFFSLAKLMSDFLPSIFPGIKKSADVVTEFWRSLVLQDEIAIGLGHAFYTVSPNTLSKVFFCQNFSNFLSMLKCY